MWQSKVAMRKQRIPAHISTIGRNVDQSRDKVPENLARKLGKGDLITTDPLLYKTIVRYLIHTIKKLLEIRSSPLGGCYSQSR
jgi:hypothetical protein